MFTPARTTLTGTAVMMACACGAGNSSAKLLRMAGLDATPRLTHPIFLGVGALLVVSGLWRIQRRTALIAALSFLTLAAASALTPPMMMSAAKEPWHGAQIAGGVLYLVFAAMLAYAFWIAFPSPGAPRTAAKAIGFTGTAAATGCACCMVTGAIAGLAVTAGGSPDVFLKYGITYFTGIAVATTGLAMFRGFRPIPWIVAGAVVTRWGGDALRVLGDWMVGDVNMRFIPGYLMYVIGAGLVIKAWAVAYEPITDAEEVTAASPEPAYSR
jgi:hypothetical protein